jgi:uncharacterized protein (DUF2141 family)
MVVFKRLLALFFLFFLSFALYQCGKRGAPSGGPKDTEPPVLIKAEPENLSINFKETKIRLYFDEYIKLQDVQNQLIVSPPFKNPPEISPLGGASKYIELIIKDTLRENTTYTLNFGQSIVDNNENNPNSYLTYVFSTGDYLDSLSLVGVVKDAFNKNTDEYISVMLYEIDSLYNDSIISKTPPNYIANTQDSTTIFKLQNLKAGKYRLLAIKDDAKNNLYNAVTDKIGFVADTITLPTDSIYVLSLFRELPDYTMATPKFEAANKLIFGYNGHDETLLIEPLSVIPDTVRTLIAKEPGKDTLNYWFTPFEADSLIFEVINERKQKRDTFTIKTRKLAADSLILTPSKRSSIGFLDTMAISATIPLVSIDTSKAFLRNRDSLPIPLMISLDSIKNRVLLDFEKEPNDAYYLTLLPDFLTDFFGAVNDSLEYRLITSSYADYGNLRIRLEGTFSFPLLLQLTDTKGTLVREINATEEKLFEFNLLEPKKYLLRAVFDANANGQWDTGNFFEKRQPEKIVYFPQEIEVRANWELEQAFPIEE